MKIAFLSDLHGSSCAARAGLEAADAWGADRIAILGDVMYHGPRNPLPQGYAPAEVARLLNRMPTGSWPCAEIAIAKSTRCCSNTR